MPWFSGPCNPLSVLSQIDWLRARVARRRLAAYRTMRRVLGRVVKAYLRSRSTLTLEEAVFKIQRLIRTYKPTATHGILTVLNAGECIKQFS